MVEGLRDLFGIITINGLSIAISIVLVILTTILAVLVMPYIFGQATSEILKSGIKALIHKHDERRVLKLVKQHMRTISINLNIVEKIELMLIDRSNIRRYVPFFNFYILMVVCLVIFAFSIWTVYGIFLSFLPALVISLLLSAMPFVMLDIMGRYNSELVRRKLANFVSVLNRWCAVKEDILYAFEKSVDSGIGEPLRTYVRDLVIQAKKGMPVEEALELFMMKVDSGQFKDFCINIIQNVKHRGNIRQLLSNMEDEFYRLEEEYSRRKISTYKDRVLIYASMLSVLAVAYFFLSSNPGIKAFYLETASGRGLMVLFSFLFAAAFVLSLRVSRFNY